MKTQFTRFALIALTAFACRPDNNIQDQNPAQVEDMRDLTVDRNFDYNTQRSGQLMVQVMSPINTPFRNARIEMYDQRPEQGGKLMISGKTNISGAFNYPIQLPDYLDSVYLRVNAIGIPNEAMVAVNGGMVQHLFGGPQTTTGKTRTAKASSFTRVPLSGKYFYMGSFTSAGVPQYLEPVNDVIDANFMADLTATLPEQVPLDTALISDQYDHDINVGQLSDVWVTWVHEGAGYRNTLAFYKYPTNNPPATANDIDSIFVIFPNMSYSGSGGGMASGNKVFLGRYPGGTSIGWVLLADAYRTGSGVNTSANHFYSNPDFNNLPNPDLRQHHVPLYDDERDLVLTAYEDIYRGASNSDRDFNDAVFYVTSNPVTAIKDYTNLPGRKEAEDRDNDGVSNFNDDYPDDPSKAFDNFTYGTLAFEDLWPGEGDYDFNDLVTEYTINTIAQGDGDIVQIDMSFLIKAIGAGSNNGFAIQFDNLSPLDVASASLPSTMAGTISLNANNTEAGQSKAVIFLADRLFDVMSPAQGAFVNTVPGNPYVTPVLLQATVNLANPVDPSVLGPAPFNPFLVVDQTRGREVHLPDFVPTTLANSSLFGTHNDDSDPQSGRYYKTDLNLPWGLHLSGPVSFRYPVEYAEILDAYLDFAGWAQSSGAANANWYTEQGRTNGGNIY